MRSDGPPVVERIRRTLVALRMPRALELLDHAVQQLERGEASALELIDTLLAEELSVRESRRIKTALMMARLSTIKTIDSFDFSFQPSLDRERILALAELQFVDRREVVHFLGPPGTGKSHLAVAIGVEAIKAGRGVYFTTLWPISSARSPRPSARGNCARAFVGSAALRCSSSTRSAIFRSPMAAVTCSSNSSTPATRGAR
jgi:IstB-like ATP binding protein